MLVFVVEMAFVVLLIAIVPLDVDLTGAFGRVRTGTLRVCVVSVGTVVVAVGPVVLAGGPRAGGVVLRSAETRVLTVLCLRDGSGGLS